MVKLQLSAALTSGLSGTAQWWPHPGSSRQRCWGRCRDRAWRSSWTHWCRTKGRSSWCPTAPWSLLQDTTSDIFHISDTRHQEKHQVRAPRRTQHAQASDFIHEEGGDDVSGQHGQCSQEVDKINPVGAVIIIKRHLAARLVVVERAVDHPRICQLAVVNIWKCLKQEFGLLMFKTFDLIHTYNRSLMRAYDTKCTLVYSLNVCWLAV